MSPNSYTSHKMPEMQNMHWCRKFRQNMMIQGYKQKYKIYQTGCGLPSWIIEICNLGRLICTSCVVFLTLGSNDCWKWKQWIFRLCPTMTAFTVVCTFRSGFVFVDMRIVAESTLAGQSVQNSCRIFHGRNMTCHYQLLLSRYGIVELNVPLDTV